MTKMQVTHYGITLAVPCFESTSFLLKAL